MARCGCTQACSCLVQASPDGDCIDVSVTGNGSVAHPYIIEADLVIDPACDNVTCGPAGLCVEPASVEALDTNTVDMTVTGSGTAADPYVISAQVIIDPASGDLLVAAPQGLLVSCEAIQDCIGQAIAAGQGVDYDDPGNGISVLPSTDLNNVIISGTDGRLYAPAGSVSIEGTPCISVTGVGTPGDPYVIAPIIAPDPNALECDVDGLQVVPSSDVGNTLVFGTDGRLFSPPGGVAVADTDSIDLTFTAPNIISGVVREGCGIKITPGVGVEADVAGVWGAGALNFPCADTNGAPVYCDAAGQLRTAPEHSSVNATAFTSSPNVPLGAPDCQTVTPMPNTILNNPSPCRPMTVMYDFVVQSELGGAGDGAVVFPVAASGYAYIDSNVPAAPTFITRVGVHSVSLTTTIPAGGSVNLQTVLGFGATYTLCSQQGTNSFNAFVRLTGHGVTI